MVCEFMLLHICSARFLFNLWIYTFANYSRYIYIYMNKISVVIRKCPIGHLHDEGLSFFLTDVLLQINP
jgi:hypothetical protein